MKYLKLQHEFLDTACKSYRYVALFNCCKCWHLLTINNDNFLAYQIRKLISAHPLLPQKF